jgi:hypothetical protein
MVTHQELFRLSSNSWIVNYKRRRILWNFEEASRVFEAFEVVFMEL